MAEAPGGVQPAARRRWIAAAVAAIILVGAASMMIGRELISPAVPDPPARAADDPVGGDLVAFDDPARAISISHPPGWRRVASGDPAVVFLAEGDNASMLVRTADLGVEIRPEDLDTAKDVSDDLVRAGQHKLLRPPKQVTLGGLPGYLYLYTFPDPVTGQRGAHAHYFLFRDQTLITLVFQTVPAERFAASAPLFDRIGETLRAKPD
jgi:hypothetical protein